MSAMAVSYRDARRNGTSSRAQMRHCGLVAKKHHDCTKGTRRHDESIANRTLRSGKKVKLQPSSIAIFAISSH